MSKRLFCVAVLLAFVIVLPKGFAEPRDGWSLEARVPASTLALLTLEDVGLMGERFEKTAIAGLFREPEMRAFLAPIETAILERMESTGGGNLLGDAQPLVMKLLEQLAGLRGQVGVALLGVDMNAGEPRAAVSLDFGEHVGDFAQFMAGLREQVDPEGNAIAQFQKDGRTWWQNQSGEGPPVTATTVDTAFVLATDPTLLESVIAGAGEESLAADAAFQSTRRRASGGGDLGIFAYANVPAVVELAESVMDDEARIVASAFGLDTIQGAAYGMSFAGDGFMDSFVLHAPGADHGIVSMVEMPPYEPKALHLVPANAFYYNEGSVNLADLVPNIRRLATGVSPEFAAEMDQGLAHLRTMLGVDLEKDVLGGLAGPSMTYASMPQTGGLFPELAIFMQVKDPAAYGPIFERLARGIAGAVTEEGDVIASTRTIEYRGRRLHLFEMQVARGDDVVPFTPTWTFMDDWLVLTLVPHAMKEIVLRSSGTPETGGGLAAQEDFRSLRAVMPKDAGTIEYFDLQGILNLLYDTGVPLLQAAVKPNVIGREVPFPLDWAQLPAARTVRPYFRSMGVFTTWNRDGIAIQMHGPIPMVGVVMVAAAVAIPAWMTVRRPDRRVSVRPKMPGRDGRVRGPRPLAPEGMPPPPAPSKINQAHAHAAQIGRYVRTFLLTENRLPADLQELVKSGTVGRLPKDPWGHDYALRVIDKRTRRFQVISAGPDGLFDTPDDIRSRK